MIQKILYASQQPQIPLTKTAMTLLAPAEQSRAPTPSIPLLGQAFAKVQNSRYSKGIGLILHTERSCLGLLRVPTMKGQVS